VLVSTSAKCILSADKSGLICVWDARSGSQTTCFHAERPSAPAKDVGLKVIENRTLSEDRNDERESKSCRKLEIRRSLARSLEQDKACSRPWQEMPKSYAIFKGLAHLRGQESRQGEDEIWLTAATLDLMQKRLAVGWNHGAVQLYNFTSGKLLQELLSEATSEIVSLAVATRQTRHNSQMKSVSEDASDESGAYIVGAEENGTVWFWPNRAPKENKQVLFVYHLCDRDSMQGRIDMSVMKIGHGVIATGTSNGRVVCWSLSTSRIMAKVDEIPEHLTRTGQNTVQSFLLLPNFLGKSARAINDKASDKADKIFANGKESVNCANEGAILAVAGSEGEIVFYNTLSGRIVSRFAVADIEYFKSASVTSLCMDELHEMGVRDGPSGRAAEPRLLFVGDSNGKMYTFDIGYLGDSHGTRMPHHKITKNHTSRHKTEDVNNRSAEKHTALKLFEKEVCGFGISSVATLRYPPGNAGWEQDSTKHCATFVLVIGALDGNCPLLRFANNPDTWLVCMYAPVHLTRMNVSSGSVSLWTPNLQLLMRLDTKSSLKQSTRLISWLRAAVFTCNQEKGAQLVMDGGQDKWSKDKPSRILCVTVMSAMHLPPAPYDELASRADAETDRSTKFHAVLFLDNEMCGRTSPVDAKVQAAVSSPPIRGEARSGGESLSVAWEQQDSKHELRVDDDHHRVFGLMLYRTDPSIVQSGQNPNNGSNRSDLRIDGDKEQRVLNDIFAKGVTGGSQRGHDKVRHGHIHKDVNEDRLSGRAVGCVVLSLHSLALHSERLDWFALSEPSRLHLGPCGHEALPPGAPMVQIKLKMTTEEQLAKNEKHAEAVHENAKVLIVRWWRSRRKKRETLKCIADVGAAAHKHGKHSTSAMSPVGLTASARGAITALPLPSSSVLIAPPATPPTLQSDSAHMRRGAQTVRATIADTRKDNVYHMSDKTRGWHTHRPTTAGALEDALSHANEGRQEGARLQVPAAKTTHPEPPNPSAIAHCAQGTQRMHRPPSAHRGLSGSADGRRKAVAGGPSSQALHPSASMPPVLLRKNLPSVALGVPSPRVDGRVASPPFTSFALFPHLPRALIACRLRPQCSLETNVQR
jgi:hypothetical protein